MCNAVVFCLLCLFAIRPRLLFLACQFVTFFFPPLSFCLQVPEDEESIYLALERESKGDNSVTAVQKALVADISHALGIDLEKNSRALCEQLRLMRKELPDCKHENELELLKAVARLLEPLIVEPEFMYRSSASDAGENEPLPPFEAFLCPLTKQV
jgi:hypothetical protein